MVVKLFMGMAPVDPGIELFVAMDLVDVDMAYEQGITVDAFVELAMLVLDPCRGFFSPSLAVLTIFMVCFLLGIGCLLLVLLPLLRFIYWARISL